jgi:hypothetical protein
LDTCGLKITLPKSHQLLKIKIILRKIELIKISLHFKHLEFELRFALIPKMFKGKQWKLSMIYSSIQSIFANSLKKCNSE